MHIKLILLIWLLIPAQFSESLYTIHITTIEGIEKPMSDFEGKKLLVIVLPLTQTAADSQYLKKIDSVSRTYADSVNIIGVPAYEYGYTDAQLSSDSGYLRSMLGAQITLMQGVYVKKSAGASQHPLFNWLTNADLNQQFDLDVRGVGQKYFISGSGDLFGNLSSAVSLSDSLMVKMLY